MQRWIWTWVVVAPVAMAADTDADGVDDSIDVCDGVPDPGQADANGDGWGDACTHPTATIGAGSSHRGDYVSARAALGATQTLRSGAWVGRRVTSGASVTFGADSDVAADVAIGSNVLIDDGAVVGFGASIGTGASIGLNAIVGSLVTVGDATIASGARLGRDATVSDGATVADGASLGSGAFVGQGAYVGAGASIGSGANLGDDVDLGAGVRVGRGAQIAHDVVVEAGLVVRAGAQVGACADVTADVARNATVPAGTCVQPKRVFVTSTTYDSFLASPTEADDACNTRAAAGGLTGTYKAWLSRWDGDPPAVSFTHSTGPYLRPDGVQIAPDWAGLVDGTLDAPINRTEFNGALANGWYVWTNTYPSGLRYTQGWNETCWGFGNTGAPGSIRVGIVGETGGLWSSGTTHPCNASGRYYCFEQ
jgi:acetyltransferase-like isoleucine patch superfamily enzyme